MSTIRSYAALLLFPLLLGCASRPGGDLDGYLEQIRAQGMSEMAYGSLMMVAALRTGWSVLTLERDPESGFYIRSYDTVTCGLPGADPKLVEAQKKKFSDAAERELRRLQPLADADGSGFVTTDEGMRFRQLYELALVAAHVCEREECTVETLSVAVARPATTVEESLAGYRTLAQRAGALRIADFPALPL